MLFFLVRRRFICKSPVLQSLIQISGRYDLVNKTEDRSFLLSAQSPTGGFGKEPEDYPDPYHSYLALAALALHGVDDLRLLEPNWNVTRDTKVWIQAEVQRVKDICT